MASALHSASDLSRSKPFIVLLALATHRILHTSTWDNSFHVILRIWALAFGGLAAVEYATNPRGGTLLGAVQGAATLASIYFIALTTSILVHRGFFHRLRKFPGPFLARFSKFYGIYAGVFSTGSCYFKWQQKLHEEYGADVIRTGPREVTVYSAEAIPIIHGPLSKCKKTTLYEAFGHITGVSLNITTDKADHRQRRKIWDRAFNAKALREYEPRLNRHALALMSKLKEEASKGSVRITNWVNFYSFDVMGDVGFNRSFGMIEKGQEDDIIKLLHESMSVLSVFSHIGWALNLIGRTKAGAKTLLEHVDWSAKVLRERMQYKPKENDVFSWLLDEDDKRVTPDMIADSRLLIIAGSDTSAATLSFLVYELCLNPAIQDRLRREMDAIHPEKSHLEVGDVAECEYLEGVIYETLRLHPAVPSGPTRVTPPEGITFPDGTYIPGDVILWTPPYAYQRDPRYWEKPLSFMPERWTTENPDAIIDKRTFLTFITGPYNCIGQKLAVMQMRSVVANLVRLFDITFAEGEDGSTLEEKSQDCFTMNVGKLDVKLSPRHLKKTEI